VRTSQAPRPGSVDCTAECATVHTAIERPGWVGWHRRLRRPIYRLCCIVCFITASMLSCALMSGQSIQIRANHRVLRVLHLLFAGLFGLVLPFICWGAEATPGHPHARAHFVFITPAPVRPDAHAVTQSVAAMMASAPEHVACISALLAESASAAGSDLPASQSVPAALAITLLFLAAFAVGPLPAPAARGGFARAATGIVAQSWLSPTTTPPPR